MKSRHTIFLFLTVFIFLPLKIYSQERVESNLLPQDPTLYDLILFSELNSSNLVKEKTMNFSPDKVFITQIGQGNSSNIRISAGESSFSLAQLGNRNFTTIDVHVKEFEGNIVQNGNNNFSTSLAEDLTTGLHLEVKQNGNENHFISNGTNSIGNKLKFDMFGDSQTIIVRNFK